MEAEVVFLPIDELGIGDEAVFVPAFGLPGGPFVEGGAFGEADVVNEDLAVGLVAVDAEPEMLHPGFPGGFVFAGHAAGGFELGPLGGGGDAGAIRLPVAFAVFEAGKGEAQFRGGFGGFDAESHAVGGAGGDGNVGAVEDGFGILRVFTEGAVGTQSALGGDELHVFVGPVVEAPAFRGFAGLGGVEGFGEQRGTRLVGADFVDAGGDGVAVRPGEVLVDDVPIRRHVAEVAVFDAGLVGEHDVPTDEVSAHHGAVFADGIARVQVHAAQAGPRGLAGDGFVAFDHGVDVAGIEAVLFAPAVQVELKLPTEGEDVVFDDAVAGVVQMDGRVGNAENDVADDVEAAGVVVGVEAEGEPRMLQPACFLTAADDVVDQIVAPLAAAAADPVAPAGVDRAAVLRLKAEVVEMVVFDAQIVPAHLHAHARAVVDVIVRGGVVHAIQADAAGVLVEDTHVMDVIVLSEVTGASERFAVAAIQADAVAAGEADLVVREAHVFATIHTNASAIEVADLPDGAALDQGIFCAVKSDR